MRILWRMLMKQFLLTLLVTWIGCILIFVLVDFFTNLPTLLQYSDNIRVIFQNMVLHLPWCMVVSITPAVLFAITFVLGNLFMRNELIIILGGGISLLKLVTPFLLFALFIGSAGVWFNDRIAIDSTREKKQLIDSFSGANAQEVDLIYANSGHSIVYAVEFFVDGELYNPSVFIRNKEGKLITRIDAERGSYDEDRGYWTFRRVQIFRIDPESGEVEIEFEDTYANPVLSSEPTLFLTGYRGIGDLTMEEASRYLDELYTNRSSSYTVALTDFYSRIATAFVPLIVALFSCGVGSRLKRNILLMSLLMSVGGMVSFYVFQEFMIVLAKNGTVSPAVGTFGSLVVGAIVGILFFRQART